MDASADIDVFRTVEYIRGKWFMDRVPLALSFCLVGLAFAVYVDPRPPDARLLIAFGFFTLVVTGFVVTSILSEQLAHGSSMIGRVFAAFVLMSMAVVVVVIHWSLTGDFFFVRSPRRPPPGYVLGWLMIAGGTGFILVALCRYLWPPKPVLTLSPAGLFYDGPMIKKLLIPWHEIEDVASAEQIGIANVRYRLDDYPAVLISKEFYERYIAIQRSLLAGPKASWDALFIPKDQSMQMVLHPRMFSIAPKLVREPIEARWKAFRDLAPPSSTVPSVKTGETPRGEPLVYGRWSITGSPWQAISFAVPIIGIAAILIHAAIMGRPD